MRARLEILKYPRTRHIEGSRLQKGDEDTSQVPFSFLAGGKHLVVEEKVDGANMGISFTPDGRMHLQSRGHYLTGGSAFEAQFDLVKAWAQTCRGVLWEILGGRYVMYGECLHKKHTVFYDALPHYFLEFDMYDREAGCFLSTTMRRRLLAGSPVVSVPVLHEGPLESLDQLLALIRPSLFKTSEWRETLEHVVASEGLHLERALERVDPSDFAEGLYVKWEEGGRIVRGEDGDEGEGRFKWVRHDFHQRIQEANEKARGHVGFQPMIPNQLAAGVDIFSLSGG